VVEAAEEGKAGEGRVEGGSRIFNLAQAPLRTTDFLVQVVEAAWVLTLVSSFHKEINALEKRATSALRPVKVEEREWGAVVIPGVHEEAIWRVNDF
jgi:hypothetical protein